MLNFIVSPSQFSDVWVNFVENGSSYQRELNDYWVEVGSHNVFQDFNGISACARRVTFWGEKSTMCFLIIGCFTVSYNIYKNYFCTNMAILILLKSVLPFLSLKITKIKISYLGLPTCFQRNENLHRPQWLWLQSTWTDLWLLSDRIQISTILSESSRQSAK